MKRYVIKKYIMAKSLMEALKKEKDVKPDDAWVDEKQPDPPANLIGYYIGSEHPGTSSDLISKRKTNVFKSSRPPQIKRRKTA